MKLKKGVLVNVPPGVPHKVYNVTEDMEIFNVFSGAINKGGGAFSTYIRFTARAMGFRSG